ncbi:MAG: SMC family ATPase [Candidatus Nanopelagicales bacterium]
MLRMKAVGPFADEQVIDFERLGAGGLFLFEGPTGVGKSTILDAITFALYGGLASDTGDAARMRSDFAAPEVRPEVMLEFSVGGVRHRITRSPEHTRPKLRGSGVTREKASVHLQRLESGAWVSRSHAKDEVGAIIGELIGLNRDQFRQVVLLPQGEFATFLRADDDQRRDVLVKLFGTHFYGRVTEQLQARAQQAGRELQAADGHLRTRMAAACEAAGLSPDDQAQMAQRALTVQIGALTDLEGVIAEEARKASAAAAGAEAVHDCARTALADAQDVHSRILRRRQIEEGLATAEAEREIHEANRIRVADARRAAPVRPLLELSDKASLAVAARRDALIANGQPTQAELDGAGWEGLAEQARNVRSVADGLTHVVELERSLVELRERLGHAVQARQEAELEQQSIAERAAKLPAELEHARAALEDAKLSAGRVQAAKARLEAVTAQAAAAELAMELEGRLEILRAERAAARRACNQASDLHALLMEQRLSNMRGELAARLVSGDPCPVCGSHDHPEPAAAVNAGVTERDVREAARQRDDAQIVRDEAEAAMIRAEAQLQNALDTAAGRTCQEWLSLRDELAQEVAEGNACAAALASLAVQVSRIEGEQERAGKAVISIAERVVAAAAEADHLARGLSDGQERVEGARGGLPTVAERVRVLHRQADSLQERSELVRAVARALSERRSADDRAQVEVRSAGFACLEHAGCAILPPAELEALERACEAWETAMTSARAQLAAADLMAVAGIDPDAAGAAVTRFQDELAEAEASARAARSESDVAVRQHQRFTARMTEVEQAADARALLALAGEEVMALDQYARGLAGTPRMSLVVFVLRHWFEQVVAAANVRLDAVSAGKYQLIRLDEGARKDSRTGLGLAVLDRHTGRQRSTGTLSGGETFYTSLSLALGLADVVVAQAGGAHLDTLFIDEGFGSLDPDTLDDVMAVIDDLRGNGRVVGIVSHVPELKERIAERLSVRRTRPDGPSSVAVVA